MLARKGLGHGAHQGGRRQEVPDAQGEEGPLKVWHRAVGGRSRPDEQDDGPDGREDGPGEGGLERLAALRHVPGQWCLRSRY